MRTHTNIAEFPGRRLARQYDSAGTAAGTAKAIGISAPTKRSQSMGFTGQNGVVSFVATTGGNQSFTLYEWHSGVAALNSGNGWILNGANSAEYTKQCDALAKISFTASEKVPFCIVAGTNPVTDAFVSGAEDEANPNTIKGNTH